MKSRYPDRIMYIEQKTSLVIYAKEMAWIGRVSFSRSGKTIYYKDKAFVRGGISGNYGGFDKEIYLADCNKELEQPVEWHRDWHPTGYLGEFWISGPKKNGQDRLYEFPTIYIDEDVREEYWLKIRNKPECVQLTSI